MTDLQQLRMQLETVPKNYSAQCSLILFLHTSDQGLTLPTVYTCTSLCLSMVWYIFCARSSPPIRVRVLILLDLLLVLPAFLLPFLLVLRLPAFLRPRPYRGGGTTPLRPPWVKIPHSTATTIKPNVIEMTVIMTCRCTCIQ